MRLKDVLKYELIGLDVEIKDSKNESLIGLRGKIVDETKNTVLIETGRGKKKRTKKVLKEQASFTLQIGSKKIQVEGSLLLGRPEERLKKRR